MAADRPSPALTVDRPPRRAGLLVFLLSFAVSLAAFGWTLADGPLVDDNPLLFSAQFDSLEKARLLLGPHGDVYWRPVAKLTMLPAILFGWALWPHRLVALLLHALNATLVWALGRRLFGARAAAAALAVFLLHPIHASALHWVSARYDLVATLFGLAALLTAPHRRPLATGALTVLACLSKEVALVTPLLVGLTAWCAETDPAPERWRRMTSSVGASAAAVAVTLALRWALLGGVGGPPEIVRPRLETALGNVLWSIPKALLLPLNMQAVAPRTAGCLAIVIAATAVVPLWLTSRRRGGRALLIGPLFVVIAALPTAPFIYLGPPLNAGYMLYLPSVGFALWLGALWSKTPGRPAAALGSAILAAYAAALTINLSAGHAASRTVAELVSFVRSAPATRAADVVIVEGAPAETRGVRMFFDHIDQFFLPFADVNAKRVLFAGPNFVSGEGRDLPWSDAAWRAKTAVLAWPRDDLTAETREAWSRLAERPDREAWSSLAVDPRWGRSAAAELAGRPPVAGDDAGSAEISDDQTVR
jgi:hypothetical protein